MTNKHPYHGTKCGRCRYLSFHAAGNIFSVAEGGDDPYNYFYCPKKDWSDGDVPDEGEPDFWENCDEFAEKTND